MTQPRDYGATVALIACRTYSSVRCLSNRFMQRRSVTGLFPEFVEGDGDLVVASSGRDVPVLVWLAGQVWWQCCWSRA